MVADDERHDELALDPEWATAAALAGAVARIAEANPGVSPVVLFDADVAAGLGIPNTEPVSEIVSNVNGNCVVHGFSYAWSVLAAAAELMSCVKCLDEAGDHEEAEDLRYLAVLCCRDARRGVLSDELLAEQGVEVSITAVPTMSVEEEDAACRAAGDVDLFQAAEYWPVRRHRRGGDPPRRLPVGFRQPRRSRPRERRSSRRTSSRGSPGRRADDDPEHDLAHRRAAA
jgi:hypothetical protein